MEQSLDSPCCCKTPRGEARRQKLLCAAAEVFMEHGYAGASVNEIVRRAGGSLSTLYGLFSNKLGLFEAVIEQKTEEIFAPFEDDSVWTDDMEASLLNYGRHMLERLIQEDAVAIFRLVISERSEDQEKIQQFFYDAGPRRGQRLLAGFLQQQVNKGRLRDMDCEAAACQFIMMIKAPFYYNVLFGNPPDEDCREASLRQATRLFLDGAKC